MRWTTRVMLCVAAVALLGLLATGCMQKPDPAATATGPAVTKAPPTAPAATPAKAGGCATCPEGKTCGTESCGTESCAAHKGAPDAKAGAAPAAPKPGGS